MKKTYLFQIFGTIALTFLIGIFLVHASSFPDVSNAHLNRDAIEYVKNQGIVSGYPDDSFRPDNTINRAEFVKIVVGSGLEYDPGQDPSGYDIYSLLGLYFSDIESGAWYIPYLRQAVQNLIIQGYPDGTFRPAQPISFVEAAKVIVITFGYSVGTDKVWYKPFVETLGKKNAIPTSIDRFEKNITRGEMAEMIYRLKASVTNKDSKTYDQLAGIDQEIVSKPEPIEISVGVTDPYKVFSQPALPLQPVGQTFSEPVFGTAIRRITDASGELERHEYSQLQAFNANNDLVLLTNDEGNIVRDVQTLAKVFELPVDINAPRWWANHPNKVIYFDSNDTGSGNVLVRIDSSDVRTGARETLVTLPPVYERVSGSISWEEMSRDGRWITAYLFRTDGNMTFLAYDFVNRQIGAELTLEGDLHGGRCGPYDGGPNWVAPSPSGNYLVIQWNRDGTGPCNGVEAFDISTGQYVGHVASHRGHSDMGYDENGNEIYVTTYFLNDLLLTTTKFPGSPNFSNEYDKIILDPNWFHVDHLSCQGPAGVCVITAGGDPDQPFGGEIYLVYTSGTAADYGENDNAVVRRLAHHRSDSECGYYHQPHASISENGQYVIFASNWGSCANGSDAYIIELE